MSKPDPQKIARLYLEQQVESKGRTKTAGEVRFIKDRGGDANEWGWGTPGPSEREIDKDFIFNARELKPLAQALRSLLMGLGHTTSAYNTLTKIKSSRISPDGNLGGKGYIQKIPDMRRQLMNSIEALSSASDTIYDEINAPHWNPAEDTLDPRDRDEVKEIVEDAEEIRRDPEAWAEGEEAEMDQENNGDRPARNKEASSAADEALAVIKMLTSKGCSHRLCATIYEIAMGAKRGSGSERDAALRQIWTLISGAGRNSDLQEIAMEIPGGLRKEADASRVASRYLAGRNS